MPVLRVVIVALDCSETSDLVIEALDNLDLQPKTKTILCHVLPSPKSDENVIADRPHQSQATLYQAAEQKLRQYQQRLINKSDLEIVSGDTTEEILRLANLYRADLIVIGNRGLKGVKRVIEGSVSSQVAAEAPCSVFVVRH